MTFDTWLAYLVTELILTITPGPAVLYVMAQGLKYGFHRCLSGTFGIISCNILFFTLAALGLGTIILKADNVFLAIKFAGAIYLAWSGLNILWKSLKKEIATTTPSGKKLSGSRSFIQGFFIQAANPKALIFFIALLPQFVNPKGNITSQFLILGITSVVPEVIILLLYGWMSVKGTEKLDNRKLLKKWKDRMVGLLLILIAVYVLFRQ